MGANSSMDGNINMKKLAIYDMDGTIVCSKHRYRTNASNKIDLQFWEENAIPDQIAKDSLLPHHKQYLNDLNDPDVITVIATARQMQAGDANFQFIENNVGVPNYIVHRKIGSKVKGTDLKISGIMAAIKDLSKIDNITIYEDNFDYLKGMTEYFENRGKSVYPIFVESEQGH